MTPDAEIRPEAPTSPVARGLMAALDADIWERYPDFPIEDRAACDRRNRLAAEDLLFVAWSEADPVGCGVLRTLDAATAEVKRMYVAPKARGTGLTARILAALEDEARRRGLRRAWLSTGLAQPEAVRLYERTGYRRMEPYGIYAGMVDTICFEKILSDPIP